MYVLLTQYSGKILGPIAKYILGPILNGIFNFLNLINFANVGVAIIIFTFVIYILMLPLTIKQQKFSKLQAKMQPEIQAVQEKYKNKKDQNSQMAMNQEVQAVYQKYGVSPTGSCVQLLIQMPILFALYRVINNVPAYVTIIKEKFLPLATQLYNTEGSVEFFADLASNNARAGVSFAKAADMSSEGVINLIIDFLNKAADSDWNSILNQFPSLSGIINDTMNQISSYNNFLGINIGYSPSSTISMAFSAGSYGLIIVAVLIPILSAVTQWINVKLTPQAATNNKSNDQANSMANSMKAMNTFMPLFSAFMCFTLPAGLGIYWIAGSVVRSVEQVLINKYIDKMDIEDEIKKNVEKREAKLKKRGIDPNKLTQAASISTKAMKYNNSNAASSYKDNSDSTSTDNKNQNYKPGSLASKANLVKEYNEKNNK